MAIAPWLRTNLRAGNAPPRPGPWRRGEGVAAVGKGWVLAAEVA